MTKEEIATRQAELEASFNEWRVANGLTGAVAIVPIASGQAGLNSGDATECARLIAYHVLPLLDNKFALKAMLMLVMADDALHAAEKKL